MLGHLQSVEMGPGREAMVGTHVSLSSYGVDAQGSFLRQQSLSTRSQ